MLLVGERRTRQPLRRRHLSLYISPALRSKKTRRLSATTHGENGSNNPPSAFCAKWDGYVSSHRDDQQIVPTKRSVLRYAVPTLHPPDPAAEPHRIGVVVVVIVVATAVFVVVVTKKQGIVLNGARPPEPNLQLRRLPPIRIRRGGFEAVESDEPVQDLSLLEHDERGEGPDGQLASEERRPFGVDPDELALDMSGCDDAQVVVQDPAPLELPVEKVNRHKPRSCFQALGQEIILGDGPDLPVASRFVAILQALSGPELLEPPLPNRGEDRIVIVVVVQVGVRSFLSIVIPRIMS